MQKIRKYFKVEGLVQGINYRWFVVDIAKSFGVTGWVRNRPDGSVELEAQGFAKDLKNFEIAIKHDHPIATVKKINTQEIPPIHNEKNFNIIY